MRRWITLAGFLALLASIMMAGGRANIVRHYYADGTYKEFWASRGLCRHHLSAHPADGVATPSAWFNDPAVCN